MSSIDKQRERILAEPPRSDITYSEAETFLLGNGFIRKPSGGGSHVNFKHSGCRRLVTLPTNTKTLKRAYIKNIKDAIDEIEDK